MPVFTEGPNLGFHLVFSRAPVLETMQTSFCSESSRRVPDTEWKGLPSQSCHAYPNEAPQWDPR